MSEQFEVIGSWFDGGGSYRAEANADRTRLRFTISDSEVYFSDLTPITRPLDGLDWAEWSLTERFGSAVDWAEKGEDDVVLIDGVAYAAVTRSAEIVRVEGCELAVGDLVGYLDAEDEFRFGRVADCGPIDKYPHLVAIAFDGGVEITVPAVAGRTGATVEVAR